MDRANFEELLYQGMETELAGEQLYVTAVEAAVNDDVREEWGKYLEEPVLHVTVVGNDRADEHLPRSWRGRKGEREKATCERLGGTQCEPTNTGEVHQLVEDAHRPHATAPQRPELAAPLWPIQVGLAGLYRG